MDREVDSRPPKAPAGNQDAAFYPGGPEDILDADEKKQIEALTDYIMTLGLKPATTAKAEGGQAMESGQTSVEEANKQG